MGRNTILMVALLAAVLLALGVEALARATRPGDAPQLCRPVRNATLAQLGRVFTRDEFRIFYTLEGPQALPDPQDRNRNGVPDAIEDVATQLVASRELFSTVMGLRHPLRQPRYATARSIDVFIVQMNQGSGLAYDEIGNYAADPDEDGRCALRIDLRNGRGNQNAAPVHELFHLYQNGYSMFKTRWYLEGAARWVESLIRREPEVEQPLPADQDGLRQHLLSQSYVARRVWSRLGALLEPEGRLPIPATLRAMTYIDGTRVVNGEVPLGAAFLRAFLDELARVSLATARQAGRGPYRWTEAEQGAVSHDPAVLGAIVTAARRQMQPVAAGNAELAAFLSLLQSVAQGQGQPAASPLQPR